MFYVSVILYYSDKTEIWLKIASKGAYVTPYTPILHAANDANQPLTPDYYFCFLQVGTSESDMVWEGMLS